MNTTKSKLGYLLGGVMLLATLACNGIAGATSNLPVVQPVEASNSAVTPAPVEAGEETTSIGSGQTSTFDPGGALAGMDSYALVIDSPQGKITFKSVKSKKEYQVINEGQGVSSEMYIKNETLYTVAAGSCVGVGLKAGDIDNLTRMGDFTTFTTGLGDETVVGEEELNGVKTTHYQVTGPTGSLDLWAAQEGGYMVRLAGQGPAGQVQIDVTEVNAVSEIVLPEACANAITLPSF